MKANIGKEMIGRYLFRQPQQITPLRFTQLPDDLLRSIPFPAHLPASLTVHQSNINCGPVWGGAVNAFGIYCWLNLSTTSSAALYPARITIWALAY